MAFQLPDLPFDYDALEPHISAETLRFHHDKHHKSYVDKLNAAVDGTPYADKALEEIIQATAEKPDGTGVFNNAAQHWNHDFQWKCLTPNGGGMPGGELARRIEADFGGFAEFVDAFKVAATGQFGSGWAWLVVDDGRLTVAATANANLPLINGQQALLTCDVWEHAYYLDYQNRRPDYVETFLKELANWEFVEKCLAEQEGLSEEPAPRRAAGGSR